MLNDPVAIDFIDKVTKEEKRYGAPRANVYYIFTICLD